MWDIELKLLEFDIMGYIIWLKRPTITLSNLTQVVMTYNDHSHPIQTIVTNSASQFIQWVH